MAYNIRYVKGIHLSKIQKVWETLETGKEMTMFQSYQWHQVLLEYTIPTDTKQFETIYAIVESDRNPCMIAPLWVVKKTFRLLNQKGAYMLGRETFSDYLNFIYQDFDGDAFDFLLSDLLRKYRIKYFTFDDVRETTSLYRHIINNYVVIRKRC